MIGVGDSIYYEKDVLIVSEHVLDSVHVELIRKQERIDYEHQHYTIHQVNKSNKI